MKELSNERVVAWRDVDDPDDSKALRNEAARRVMNIAREAMKKTDNARKCKQKAYKHGDKAIGVPTAELLWRTTCKELDIEFKFEDRPNARVRGIGSSILKRAELSYVELESLIVFVVTNWSTLEEEFAWMKGGRARNGRMSVTKAFPSDPSFVFFLTMANYFKKIYDKNDLTNIAMRRFARNEGESANATDDS